MFYLQQIPVKFIPEALFCFPFENINTSANGMQPRLLCRPSVVFIIAQERPHKTRT